MRLQTVRPVTHIIRYATRCNALEGWAIKHRTARGLQTTAEAPHAVPLRKQLKDEAKRKKKEARSQQPSTSKHSHLDDWELTVGIEIHARLNTGTKLFSSATSTNSASPNDNVELFDTALPGSQPQLQISALIPAIRAALALNCAIQPSSSWDRKHYFYQDQPNGYQITQYYGELLDPKSVAKQTTNDLYQNLSPKMGKSPSQIATTASTPPRTQSQSASNKYN